MAYPSNFAPSQAVLFSCIPQDFVQIEESGDLLIGENRSVTITLSPEETLRFRDIVVLGRLIIERKKNCPEDSPLPRVMTRDLFLPGRVSMTAIKLTARNIIQPKNKEAFREGLEAHRVEWRELQKEWVERIGLISILA